MSKSKKKDVVEVRITQMEKTFSIFVNESYAEQLKTDPTFLASILQNTRNIQQNVKSAASEQDDNRYLWPDKAVLLLIKEVAANYDKLKSGEFSQKMVWQLLSDKMTAHGYEVNPSQCYSKWRGLNRSYKNITSRTLKSGDYYRDWTFFNAMDRFMKSRLRRSPSPTYKTPKRSRYGSSPSKYDTRLLDEFRHDHEYTQPSPRPPASYKRRNLSLEEVMVEVFEESNRDAERRHQETLVQKERIYSLLKRIYTYK